MSTITNRFNGHDLITTKLLNFRIAGILQPSTRRKLEMFIDTLPRSGNVKINDIYATNTVALLESPFMAYTMSNLEITHACVEIRTFLKDFIKLINNGRDMEIRGVLDTANDKFNNLTISSIIKIIMDIHNNDDDFEKKFNDFFYERMVELKAASEAKNDDESFSISDLY